MPAANRTGLLAVDICGTDDDGKRRRIDIGTTVEILAFSGGIYTVRHGDVIGIVRQFDLFVR
jgi:anthranilate phosphoribosyltransferase